MKRMTRFILVLFIGVVGVIPTLAQRDIKLKLNKLNFENFDTVKVEASFVGFEDDPVAGDVVADIVNPQDSVIQTVVMHRNADGTYYAELPVPPNELNTHEDVLKLCHKITRSGDSMLASDTYVGIVSPDFDVYSTSTIYGGISVRGIPGTFHSFQKVPFEKITYITVMPSDQMTYHLKANNYKIYFESQKSHPIDNIFCIQVFAQLRSGEKVVAMRNITLPVIEFTAFGGDVKLLNSPNNIVHGVWTPYIIK